MISIKSLADGQLGNAKAVIYTVPAATSAIIRLVSYCATGAQRTVNLYVTPSGGTSRRIIPKDMILGAGSLMQVDDVLTLEAGDALEGDASVANEIDYTVGGVERT